MPSGPAHRDQHYQSAIGWPKNEACAQCFHAAGVGTKGSCEGGNVKVDGPWLNGSHSHTADQPYATFARQSDFAICSASDIWIFLDDDPWTINDAACAVIASAADTVDYCSPFHDNATGFSFADGHAEIHKWKAASGFITARLPGATL